MSDNTDRFAEDEGGPNEEVVRLIADRARLEAEVAALKAQLERRDATIRKAREVLECAPIAAAPPTRPGTITAGGIGAPAQPGTAVALRGPPAQPALLPLEPAPGGFGEALPNGVARIVFAMAAKHPEGVKSLEDVATACGVSIASSQWKKNLERLTLGAGRLVVRERGAWRLTDAALARQDVKDRLPLAELIRIESGAEK